MAKAVKRGISVLCAIVILASMLAIPASADDWQFEFTGYHSFSDWSTQNGTWRDVPFRFRGTGIQRVSIDPRSNNSRAPVQAYISYVNWKPAGQWCTGLIRVRALNNGDGAVYIYLTGQSSRCYSILIGY